MEKINLQTKLHNLQLKNPVLTASGTFGYGEEYADFINLEQLGGMVVKGTTGQKREGNPYPRMAETPSGMLNAVGLQNKGVDAFIQDILPRIQHLDTEIIVNVSGSTIEEYVEVAQKLNACPKIRAIEVNISCPNVKQGGMAFGTQPKAAQEVVQAVRKVYDKTLIIKLSPNVTSITDMAIAVEEAGADVISLINTLLGMAVDIDKRKPILSTITGGLSGPAIKPVALRMVWQCSKVVKIPIIGMGGITNAKDAIEFLLVGASAIQVGTANFVDPATTIKIIQGIEEYMYKHNVKDIKELVGQI